MKKNWQVCLYIWQQPIHIQEDRRTSRERENKTEGWGT